MPLRNAIDRPGLKSIRWPRNNMNARINHCSAFSDWYHVFLVFNAKKYNYCIDFDTLKLKIFRRIIIVTI